MTRGKYFVALGLVSFIAFLHSAPVVQAAEETRIDAPSVREQQGKALVNKGTALGQQGKPVEAIIDRNGEILPDKLEIRFNYHSTGQSFNGMSVSRLDGCIFEDVASGEKLVYKKLVIDGETVVSVQAVQGQLPSEGNMVKFVLGGGKYKQVGSGSLMSAGTFEYKLKNGVLALLLQKK
jgi:hypothetical protein